MSGYRELSSVECAELIAPDGVGRLALCTPDGADIVPLSYVVDRDSLVFRISPHGILGELTQGRQRLAFEIDDLDLAANRGWSVVLHGRTEPVTDEAERHRLAEVNDPVPWARGMRRHYVRLRWTEISGRAFGDAVPSPPSESHPSPQHPVGPWSHG